MKQLNRALAHNDGNRERMGVPVENLEKVMIGDAANITGRQVGKNTNNLEAAIAEFAKAHHTILQASDKLHATADEQAKRAKVAVSRAKDSAAQMTDAMLRINKMLGPDFEQRITQLERLAESLERLRECVALIGERDIELEIDGGVTTENAAAVREAGATLLVAGTSTFRAPDVAAAVRQISGN